MNKAIFTKDFKARPFWWEAHEPKPLPEIALPKQARVVIIGAGYAGLNAALELATDPGRSTSEALCIWVNWDGEEVWITGRRIFQLANDPDRPALRAD